MYTLLLKAFIFHQQGKVILKVIPTISFLCYNFSCVVDSAILLFFKGSYRYHYSYHPWCDYIHNKL